MVKGWHVPTARCDTGAIALLQQGDPPSLTPNTCPSTWTGPSRRIDSKDNRVGVSRFASQTETQQRW